MTHLTEEQLFEYLHGHFTPGSMSEVKAHLEACEECRALSAQELRLETAIYALPQSRVSHDFTEILMAEIEPHHIKARGMQGWYWIAAMMIISITALLSPVDPTPGPVSQLLHTSLFQVDEFLQWLHTPSAILLYSSLAVSYILWAFDQWLKRWFRVTA